MGSPSGSHFHHQSSPRMLPPREQPRHGGLHTSLTLLSADAAGSPSHQVRASNSDQVRESPAESASSRETWPNANNMISKRLEDEKEGENGFADHSVVRRVSNSSKMSLRDVVRERVDIISERMQHLPEDILDKLKSELRNILEGTGGSTQGEEFLFLQKIIQSRNDLTDKTLMSAHRVQLEILVAVKTGIQAFLHPIVSLSQASLVDVFLFKKCRNIACGTPLPAENCTCKSCSMKNGFCNLCMCVICNKFDFEVNTCRWVGCDLCSHWTHTDCAIRNGLIGVGSDGKIASVPGDMLFRCRACSRASELLGWVKDVFQHCAPSWDRAAFIRELDYVGRIFRGSEDPRGRKLFWKCEELIDRLRSGMVEAAACQVILLLFQELEVGPSRKSESEGSGGLIAPQEAMNRIADVVQEAIRKMELVAEEKMQMVKKARLAVEACDQELMDKAREVASLKMERQRKKQQIDELDSIVRLKQAEADMFDLKASEARREAEGLQRIVLSRSETTEEEDYASRYLKLRLNEAEAEKQYLYEKMKLQDGSKPSSQSSGGGVGGSEASQMLMYSKMQDMLKNIYSSPPSKVEGKPSGL